MSDTTQRLGDGQAHPARGRATGTPVKVVAIIDASSANNAPQDDLCAGNRAAVRTINETLNGLGGSGRPVELEIFETNLDPAQTVECARRAAADPECVAVVGSLVVSYEISTILAEAGLASIPAVPCTKDEYYNPLVFNINGGHISMDGGKIATAFASGAEHPGSLTTDIPGIPWFVDVHNLTLQRFGLPEETRLVAAPYVVDDIAPWVQKSVEGVDAVMLTLVNNDDTVNAILARHELGITTPFIVEGMSLTPAVLEKLGPAGEGVLVASLFPAFDADVIGQRRYLDSMREAGYVQYLGDKSQMGWITFDLLNHATQGLASITRESVLAGLRAVTDYTGGGITPPLNFSEPTGPGAGYPRLYNWTYYPTAIRNGTLVSAVEGGGWAELPTDIPESPVAWAGFPAS
ncbi:ABC transporter substrate-binding protein [Nocardia sp. NPDC005745]|uniref:ABC transporter substrate-binding protein n=1 Tax=Nocardia sp. NPDC005745 TaxID=3157061 RepID=UPI00340CAB70